MLGGFRGRVVGRIAKTGFAESDGFGLGANSASVRRGRFAALDANRQADVGAACGESKVGFPFAALAGDADDVSEARCARIGNGFARATTGRLFRVPFREQVAVGIDHGRYGRARLRGQAWGTG